MLVVWKLDRLGRDLRHLVNTVHDLTRRGVGLKVLTGQGAAIDTTTPAGKLIFGIFAALAEFERESITERTRAGLLAARASGHAGGRPYTMTPAKVRLAIAAMGKPETDVAALCAELGISRQTLYRHVSSVQRDHFVLMVRDCLPESDEFSPRLTWPPTPRLFLSLRASGPAAGSPKAAHKAGMISSANRHQIRIKARTRACPKCWHLGAYGGMPRAAAWDGQALCLAQHSYQVVAQDRRGHA
jgi:hypothetical protein